MRTTHRFAVAVAGFIAIVPGASRGSAADPVTLSRYIVATSSSTLGLNLDQTVVEALCKDEDGCDVILTRTFAGDDPASTNAVRTRWFLSLNNTVFYTSSGVSGTDDDDTAWPGQPVLSGGSSTCLLTDADNFLGDVAPGFGLVSSSGAQICRLVLID